MYDLSAMAVFSSLFFALCTLPLAGAQFPAVCNTQSSLSTKTCCPDNCSTHGTCVSIREEVERSWNSSNETVVSWLRGMQGYPQDVRYQWPLKIFERVCSCDEGWGSYDCSQCDFGFIANEADECVKRDTSQLLVRRNFIDLSDQERLNLVQLMEASKNEENKKWAAVTSVPEEANGYYILQNVSTYDMMVFVHLLTGKEKDSIYCPSVLIPNDPLGPGSFVQEVLFAHFGSSFLPWHRYYLLQYESELRHIGEKMGISNFTLPYWDWTPTSSCLMFTHELFGTPEYSDSVVNVNGALFENGKWPVICDQLFRLKAENEHLTVNATECAQVKTLCDIEGDHVANRPLQRGAVTDLRNLRLPDYKLIAMSLTPDQIEGTYGLTYYLEGDTEQCAGEAVKCAYDANEDTNMHGLVHEYMGGQMSTGGTAPNDPVFFLHHANVDRIYERWLQKYNGILPSYQPIDGGSPGHNFNDYLVPMFPVRKNADFYKESKELGYIYDDLPWSIPSTNYQYGCPSDHCDKGGYPPTVLVNSASAYCTKFRMG